MHLPISNRPTLAMVSALGMALLLGFSQVCPAQTTSEADTISQDEAQGLSDYTMGVFLLENGQPQRAIPYLETAWRAVKSEQIGNTLCEAYFRAGDLRSCDDIIAQLLAMNDENDAALLFRARISYFRGHEEDALQDLQTLRRVAPPSFEVERLIARIQLELGLYEDALASYQNAIHIDPGHPVMYYRAGILLRGFERIEEAEEALRTAIELQPAFAEAVVELAEILVDARRYDDAEAVLAKLLEQEGDFPDAFMMLVNLQVDQDHIAEAIALLEARKQAGALSREGDLVLGRLYYEVKNFDAALDVFAKIYAEGTQTSEMARVLGELSLAAGRSDEALSYYRSAITMTPDDYRNYMALFFASVSRFNEEGAPTLDLTDDERKDLLENASRLIGDEDFDGFYTLGISYQGIDDYEGAKAFFSKALELNPDDDRVILNLAGAMERLGEYDDAAPLLARLHERKPNDPRVCNFYGYLLALMNTRLDEAEAMIKTALRQEPDNGYYVDSLGWVYFKRGEYEKAVIELERATAIVGDDPVILEHLGDAYQSLKRFQKALAAYQRSADLQGENAAILDKIDSTRGQIGN